MSALNKDLVLFIDSCFEEELYQSGLEILDVVLIPKNNGDLSSIPFLPKRHLYSLLNLIIQKDHANYISQKAAQLLYRIIYSKRLCKNELNNQWCWLFSYNKCTKRSKELVDSANIDHLNAYDNLQLNFTDSIFSKFSNIWKLIQYCFEELSPHLYILLDCIITILEIDFQEHSKAPVKELEKTLLLNSFKNNDREKLDIKQILAVIFTNIDSEEYEYSLSSDTKELSDKKKNVITSLESMMLRKRFLHLIYDTVCALPIYFNKFSFENELSIYFKNLEINKFILYFSNAIPSTLKINLCHLLLVKYSVHSKLSKPFSELSIDLLKLWPTIVPQAKLKLSEKAKYSFLLQTLLKHIHNDITLEEITQEEKHAIFAARTNRILRFNDEIKKIKEKNKISQNDLCIQNIFEHSEFIINLILEPILKS
ncbi:hypothetical protein PORY_000523 [Pneumocystis oryctolagi]|uniref:Uncharacterized protein n=1 Tax=Pneumocystis oryctolagi TaxID=42067 RepID=A0ACB7CGZ5_9ASCO|nr:hypothetical protein PORY_000523 [Pneumocystis oryctolagi]